ncbi:glycerophosphocholine cholinephosphodiesterase ENPP6-like [Physella acuta]|uniref:glycerophosphocholine cholinephosphodiesterase ENPP6-like n=1 Tax=Physella acuta TaxID=109671 RepID=UPI0027DAD66F|nr:glycerophosphocholine cholinephosphodiesterase ENPP6-like [Physella acuta]
MIARALFLLAWITWSCVELKPLQSQKLLVVLLDGVRWDYVDKFDMKSLKRIHTLGARAGYMKSDYPTLSFPNYYTIMTGLHTESHGITGNFMYDDVKHEAFLNGINKDSFKAHWWDGGEPLWVTAVLQKKSSYMFYWPGCEVTITPTYCRNFTYEQTLEDFQDALDESLQLLTTGTTDLAGHVYLGSFTPHVYTLLKTFSPHMKVYKKSDIPSRFFYKHGKHVSPLTCVADLGWTIIHPFSGFPTKKNSTFVASHGYDNNQADMRGIFYAVGPSFKPQSTVDYINAVDPYNIMCSILGLRPAPNNGSSLKINRLLKKIKSSN